MQGYVELYSARWSRKEATYFNGPTQYVAAFVWTDDWRIMGYLTTLIQLQKLAVQNAMKRGNDNE
jgi:hypothetical protein